MPITIDGTGSISGIVAGGLPDGSINNADLATDAVSTSKILNGAVTTAKMGSAEQSGLCKAWVNFNGIDTVAIRASYNVSSITDNGTGTYTVNLTSPLADANYSGLITSGFATGVREDVLGFAYTDAPYAMTASAYTIKFVRADTNAAVDTGFAMVAIFR